MEEALAAGVDINTQDALNGATALILAAACNHVTIVALLLFHNADISLRDLYHKTAEEYARIFKHAQIIELFEEHKNTLSILSIDEICEVE